MLSDIKLQLRLAKKLPNLIYGGNSFRDLTWIHEVDGEGFPLKITPREWDWVVREVVNNIDADTAFLIQSMVSASLNPTWQQRAQALVEIGVI